MKKVLVIEDNAKHLDDAKVFFSLLPEIEIVYAKTLFEAQVVINGRYPDYKPQVEGVISDIFFPRDERSKSEEPIGVGIQSMCDKKGIPCVLNTDDYHHGERLQWITDIYGMIDSGQRNQRGESKLWAEAWEELQRRAEEAGKV